MINRVARISKRVFYAAALVTAVGLPTSASACPFCDPGPAMANQVKATIFSDSFWPNLFAVSAPFVSSAALTAFIYFGQGRRSALPINKST
jgi:hypothetical protein